MKELLLDINKLSIIRNAYAKFITSRAKNQEFLSSYAIFLVAISENEFHSQQELSAFIGCNKAHTSRTLLKMKLNGFIKISPPPNDKIKLTEKGEEFLKEYISIKDEFTNHLWNGIEEKELKQFIHTFDKICENAKNLDQI